jgi:hypothetical protein
MSDEDPNVSDTDIVRVEFEGKTPADPFRDAADWLDAHEDGCLAGAMIDTAASTLILFWSPGVYVFQKGCR